MSYTDNRTFNEQISRIAVGGYEDAQEVRKAMMNRVRDIVRKKNEGIPFDKVENEKEEMDFGSEYDDDQLADTLEEMVDSGTITTQEYKYIDNILDTALLAEEMEERFEQSMMAVKTEPVYDKWLKNVYGVSHVLSAKLLHMFGYCENFERVSNLWSYCGLAPGQTRTRGEKLSYNPDAKTLGWLVADRIIMQGTRSRYKEEFYDPYKEKQIRRMERAEEMTEAELEEVKWTPPESRGHADTRARRYLAKKFLKHYWAIARELKGYETPDEWVLTHGGHKKRTDVFENPFYAKRELMG